MAQPEAEKKPFERLPVDVVPLNYKLELNPDLKAFTFQGKLETTVQVLGGCNADSFTMVNSSHFTTCVAYTQVAQTHQCSLCIIHYTGGNVFPHAYTYM